MLYRLCPSPQRFLLLRTCCLSICFSPTLEESLDGFVGHEEERCAGSGADERGADAGIDAAETAGMGEAGGGLEAGFEGVDGVEGEVDCSAC